MIHSRIFITFTFLLSPLMLLAKAAPTILNGDVYKRWVILSSQDLMDKARNYITNPEKRDSALVWYSIVANRWNNKDYSETKDDLCVGAMNNLGYMYFYFYQDYFKSYSYLKRGLDLALENGYDENLPYLYLNIGNVYNVSDEISSNELQQKKCLECYKKSFAWAIKTKTYDIVCITMGNMLSTTYNLNQLDSIRSEIAIFQKTKIPKTTPLLEFCHYKIKIYKLILAHHYDEALKLCDESLKFANDPTTPERFYLSVMGVKAHILSLKGDNPRAIALLGEIEKKAVENELPDFLVGIYREFSLYYKEMNQTAQYEKYRVKYLELKDSLLTESQLARVNNMQFLDELDAINEQIKQAEREKEQQTMVLWVVVAVSLAIVIVLVVTVRAYRKQRRANRYLYEKSVESLQREANERVLRHQLQEQLELNAAAEEKKPAHTQRRSIDEATQNELMHKIEEKMEDVSVISNPDFSLKRLAELIDEKYWNVSQVINDNYGKNFNALLGEYRVNEACRRINDTENYGQYTIEGISASVGFKSRSNFVTVFKSITGLTPSEYQRAARER